MEEGLAGRTPTTYLVISPQLRRSSESAWFLSVAQLVPWSNRNCEVPSLIGAKIIYQFGFPNRWSSHRLMSKVFCKIATWFAWWWCNFLAIEGALLHNFLWQGKSMSKWKTSCRYLLAKVCLDRSNQTMRATHTIGGQAMRSGRIPKNSWQRLQLASCTKFGSVSRCKDGNRSSVWRQAVSSFKVTLHNTKEYRIPGKLPITRDWW